MTTLRYIGAGAYRPDLPARNIDAAELAVIATRAKTSTDTIVERARSSGLYIIDGEADSATERETANYLTPAPEPEQDKPLDEMGRDELRAVCKELGLGQAGKVEELRERIRAKITEEAPALEIAPESDFTRGNPAAEQSPEPEQA